MTLKYTDEEMYGGTSILKDGIRMTVEEVVGTLNEYEEAERQAEMFFDEIPEGIK